MEQNDLQCTTVSWGLLIPNVVQHTMLVLMKYLQAASRGDLDISLIDNMSRAGDFGNTQKHVGSAFWKALPINAQLGSQTINVPLVSLGH